MQVAPCCFVEVGSLKRLSPVHVRVDPQELDLRHQLLLSAVFHAVAQYVRALRGVFGCSNIVVKEWL